MALATSTAPPRFALVSVPFVVASLLYLAMVSYVTLGEVPWRTAANEAGYGVLSLSTWLDRTTWTSGSSFEFVANVVMFVPIGFLLRAALPRLSGVIVLCLAALITLTIEIVQIPLERVSDPRDLVANGLGALIGVLAGWLFLSVRRGVSR